MVVTTLLVQPQTGLLSLLSQNARDPFTHDNRGFRSIDTSQIPNVYSISSCFNHKMSANLIAMQNRQVADFNFGAVFVVI